MAVVRHFLDLSTSHLPERVAQAPLHGIDGVIAYELAEYGWLLWVPNKDGIAEARMQCEDAKLIRDTHDDESDAWMDYVPREIIDIWEYARGLGCDYVFLDRDGPVDQQLPTWEW